MTTRNIAETRSNLVNLKNELTESYSQMLHNNTNKDMKDNQDILFLNNQNKLQLQEISELEEKVSKLNKKCYDYEQIINNYQGKMVEMEEEQKCEDKVSIVKIQADELHKKDQYIDQLQQKIKFLQGDKKNITFKLDDNIDSQSQGWSPTSSKNPINENMDIEENNIEKKEEEIEESDDSEIIEYKQIKFKGTKYYIIVGEDPQVVYEILDDEDAGDRVGIRKKKTKGNGYTIDFD